MRPADDQRRADRAEITVGALFQEYMERYAKLHKATWKEDQDQFMRHLTHWEHRKLSSIQKKRPPEITSRCGRDKGRYAANRLLALCSVLFNKAIEFGLWDKLNPASGIKKFREQSREAWL